MNKGKLIYGRKTKVLDNIKEKVIRQGEKVINSQSVYGSVIDEHTRCAHYFSKKDIIAIKFACCQRYYACYKCHLEHADHPITVWQESAFSEKAILCGECKQELTINEYMNAACCHFCQADFNPGCQKHYSFYFAVKPS